MNLKILSTKLKEFQNIDESVITALYTLSSRSLLVLIALTALTTVALYPILHTGIILWFLSLVVLIGYRLYSAYIFKTIGLEPKGRIIIGILELIASILLLIPKTVLIGALLTFGLIGGAIVMHITQLGIVVNNDNGILFIMAIITFLLASILIYIYRKDIPKIGTKI